MHKHNWSFLWQDFEKDVWPANVWYLIEMTQIPGWIFLHIWLLKGVLKEVHIFEKSMTRWTLHIFCVITTVEVITYQEHQSLQSSDFRVILFSHWKERLPLKIFSFENTLRTIYGQKVHAIIAEDYGYAFDMHGLQRPTCSLFCMILLLWQIGSRIFLHRINFCNCPRNIVIGGGHAKG